jgi:hypothetical protein
LRSKRLMTKDGQNTSSFLNKLEASSIRGMLALLRIIPWSAPNNSFKQTRVPRAT